MDPSGTTDTIEQPHRGVQYDNLIPLLDAMVRDFKELAKKKPEAVLNKRKVEVVNRLLADVLKILDGEPQRGFLDLLDEDDLPQYSDVVLILGQVEAAMAAFKKTYWLFDYSTREHYWTFDEDEKADEEGDEGDEYEEDEEGNEGDEYEEDEEDDEDEEDEE